jgi:hypothetical protein
MSLPTVVGKLRESYVTGGNVRRHHMIISGPTSYVTGGVKLNSRDIGNTWFVGTPAPTIALSKDRIAHFIPVNSSGVAEADKTRDVYMFITDLAGTEVANASNQSTKKFLPVFDMEG